MFQEFYPIKLQGLGDVSHILSPDQVRQPGTLHSPALEVMTDFERVTPVLISESTSSDDALEFMKAQHVRLLFATDGDDEFSGIVSAADLLGDRLITAMQQKGLDRKEVEVKHLMLARTDIHALTYEQVRKAKIGDIMSTLKGSGDQHVLVIDESLAGVKRVRGIISSSDISRYLKISFDVMYQAKSFADIERVIADGMAL